MKSIDALTHWGRVTHICVGKLTIIGSDNGLSPGRRQAIIWTNVGILLIGPLGTNFSEMLIKIYTFSFKKMHLKMSSGKRRPFCLDLNVLRLRQIGCHSADIFKCIFLNEKVVTSFKISLKFVPESPNNRKPPLVQIMVWHWFRQQAIIWTNDDLVYWFIDATLCLICVKKSVSLGQW